MNRTDSRFRTAARDADRGVRPIAGVGALATFGLFCALGCFAPIDGADADEARTATVDAASVVRYVESCRKPNGAFGPRDQEYTDAAWNYPAVQTLALLGEPIERPDAILEHGTAHPKGHGGMGHQLVFHQAMIEKLVRQEAATADAKEATLDYKNERTWYYGSPLPGTSAGAGGDAVRKAFRQANKLEYYNLSSLYFVLAALEADGRRPANPEALISFVRARQAPCGGFVDLRAEDAEALDAEAHVAHTFFAIAALQALGAEANDPEACARFVRSCQILDDDRARTTGDGRALEQRGGVRWNPDPDRPGNYADVYYAWAAAKTLEMLGERPEDPQKLAAWIDWLQNVDGGFGDQPGWPSRLYSTYHAVDALGALARIAGETADERGSHARRAVARKQVAVPPQSEIPEGRYGVYQALFKVPFVEPDELQELHERGLNLLFVKPEHPLRIEHFAQAEPLLETIAQRKLPMDVVLCPEAYGHESRRLGGAVLHHIGNFTLDPQRDASWRERCMAIYDAGKRAWPDYQEQVLKPLQRMDALCYPEMEFEQEYAYSAFDDGVYGRGGYDATLAGMSWPPRDFVRVFPWRERYVGLLPPVADTDAHGDLEKWSSQLDHVRNVYLAEGPSYEAFLDAARNGRVVCVVREPENVASGTTYYGSPAAVAYLKDRVDEWKWW